MSRKLLAVDHHFISLITVIMLLMQECISALEVIF